MKNAKAAPPPPNRLADDEEIEDAATAIIIAISVIVDDLNILIEIFKVSHKTLILDSLL